MPPLPSDLLLAKVASESLSVEPGVAPSQNGATLAVDTADTAVEVTAMQFAYPGEAPLVTNFSLKLPRGSRCLLVGANGAGRVGS